jgi:hypothetical protein
MCFIINKKNMGIILNSKKIFRGMGGEGKKIGLPYER